jgi:hypothetical protein
MKLSEAIREGAKETFPGTVAMFSLRSSSGALEACALGAAYYGRFGNPTKPEDFRGWDGRIRPSAEAPFYKQLSAQWPELLTEVEYPLGLIPGQLQKAIYMLNDNHNWTREQIADWVESLGY